MMPVWNRVRLATLDTQIDMKVQGAQNTDQYILKDMEISPATSVISKSDLPRGGSVRQNARPEDIQIVIRALMVPDYVAGVTVAAIRDNAYQLMTPGFDESVALTLWTPANDIAAKTNGWVSKVEPNPFSKDPELVITMETNAPYLSGPAAIESVVTGAIIPPNTAEFNRVNPGNARTGFTFEFEFSGAYTSPFSLRNERFEIFRLDGYSFQTGDRLIISTVDDARYVRVLRGGGTIDLLPNLTDDSVWWQLHAKTNYFALSSTAPGQVKSLKYTPKYWGI